MARAVLADEATQREDCGTWVSEGPATLMDSAEAGAELDVEYPGGGRPARASVPRPAGRWEVRAVNTEADEEYWVRLVQLLPMGLSPQPGAPG
ncbi:Imm21 family immunity protein [Streptomyces sp. NPDC001822]|uniref:Imm21 family immunity protein n=1 Tax=Streptomyces sp. NPDC001822 TaxID=3364614 RepID=UPI0036856762